MNINQNPFISDIFTTKWLSKFNNNKPIFDFSFIDGIRFINSSILPIYVNVGKNHTKGISYTIKKRISANFKKSIVLIYDVPDYFSIKTSEVPDQLKIHRIKQYPGYLTNLREFKNIDDFLQKTFSSKTRSNLKRYKHRLELCFDINSTMYYGEISRVQYDFIFEKFRSLLEKRFAEKKKVNNNLNLDEWAFYYDVAFPMIQEKKASLFVLYEGCNPIAITLNYFSENILFYGITVFDTDFSKFRIGKIALLKLFSWCFENNIYIFDFSKGDYDYKTRWMTKSYNFEYHVFYNRTSIISRTFAYCLKIVLTLKQFLREKGLHTKLHQLTFWIKTPGKSLNKISKFSFYDISRKYPKSELNEISLNNNDHEALKAIVNEFLFLNKEALRNLSIWKVLNEDSAYLLKGKETSKLLVIN